MASFSIAVGDLKWLGDEPDHPKDLCAHGHVTVSVGGETLEDDCCASASALRMLRTLSEDHAVEEPGEGQQMLPCCGHFMVPDGENVYVGGCCNGTDYAVSHRDDEVVIATESGREYAVGFADYRGEVLKFARQIEAFYNRCAPKAPEDQFARDGYAAFWMEWNRRMRDAVSQKGTGAI